MSDEKRFNLKGTALTMGAVVALAGAIALPAAVSHAADAPVQIAACSPCAAKKGCNPCAAKNPCNPCAANKKKM